ncbi:MAG: aminotransferase class V-fold PLP-dependent enzyme [Pirellulales bacterium]
MNPLFKQDDRIYLDNAATSWPKPEGVYAAVDHYQRRLGAPAGRSAYREAVEVEQAVAAVRQALARLLSADDARRIIFTFNGSDALNLAIHGVLAGGGHVVTSQLEHNSVLRPLRHLEQMGRVEVSRIACPGGGAIDPEAVRAALRTDTRLVVLTHASNVTGALQPVAEVAKAAHQHGALVLVDAAQTLGELPLDVDQLGADLLAAPGHKGLLGPLGSGLLYVRRGVEQHLAPLKQGGTGSFSDLDEQPAVLPDRYESGNLNVPGILGLGAGIEWLQREGLEAVRRRQVELTGRLMYGLAEIAGVGLYGPKSADERVGVVSITLEGVEPGELAAALDSAYRVQVRAGLHCAPGAHAALGTIDQGGTVRFSPGPFSTIDEIDQAVAAVGQIAAATMVT